VKVGINGSRARSGGAKAHLLALNKYLLSEEIFEFAIMFVPSGTAEDYGSSENVKIVELAVDKRGILKELFWELFQLPKILKSMQIDLILNVDAGTVCPYQPSVVISQDMLSFEPGAMSKYKYTVPWIRLLCLKYIQLRSLSRADGVIFLTEYARDTIANVSRKEFENTTVINHGVRSYFFNNSDKVKKKPDCTNIIYVSNFAPYKHHDSIVLSTQFLKNLGKMNFLFIGGGTVEECKNLEMLIKENSTEDISFHLEPFKENSKLPDYYKNSDLIIFASSCENMPITLMEGMATGLPICCSNRGPMVEVLGPCGLYFDPDSPKDIAKRIEDIILNNTDSLPSARDRARSWIWADAASKTFEFCKKVYSGS
jgi:glycosyltransferase involved in cell wall biosynthesis